MSVSSRPHQFPTPVPDGDVIAWKCAACGEWIREYAYDEQAPCRIDWRRPPGLLRSLLWRLRGI